MNGGENMIEQTTAYSCQTPENFRYRVILWSTEYHLNGDFWWVHDTKRNTFRKIGRVKLHGVNYYDKAVEFCKNKQEVNYE